MAKMRKFHFWNENGDEKDTEQLSLSRAVKAVQSDSMYVVDLMENGQVVETRNLPGKSRAYAVSVVENWEQGIIQLLVD